MEKEHIIKEKKYIGQINEMKENNTNLRDTLKDMQLEKDEYIMKYKLLIDKYTNQQSNFEREKETFSKEKEEQISEIKDKLVHENNNLSEIINKMQAE